MAPDLDQQLTLRLSSDTLARARNLARVMSKPPHELSASEVLRHALTIGLEQLSKEHGT